ncbi:NUDIX domain-containing protein [Micromonospora echinofusca]|uniref:NUDIX domain-containing protein n=2 Tax=Micromonospora echinofusca TaxID=47858 RepID=A0ABS3VKP5_MICEH|nr:NUDIX domain-containing protein [Micromonospora echinofusca]
MQAAGILLVRPDGSMLLQLRDGHAPTDANRWGIPGGLVNPGEAPEDAARRELREETGLAIDTELTLFWSGITADRRLTAYVYCTATNANAEDIATNEGRAMQFVPADEVPSLDLAHNAAPVLRSFISSDQFRQLAPAALRRN